MSANGREVEMQRAKTSGFTLLELLTVMVIMFMLMGMGTVAMRGLVRGSGIRGATEMVKGVISQARQTAIMQRKDVYVFFRKDGDVNGISMYAPYGPCAQPSGRYLTAPNGFPGRTNTLVGARLINLTRSYSTKSVKLSSVAEHDQVDTVYLNSGGTSWSEGHMIGFELNTERFLPQNMEFEQVPDPIVFNANGGTGDGSSRTIKMVEKGVSSGGEVSLKVDGLTGWIE